MTLPTRLMLGKPLKLTPEELDQAATVTPFDVIMARAFWQRYVPARYLDLLDALPADFVGAT